MFVLVGDWTISGVANLHCHLANRIICISIRSIPVDHIDKISLTTEVAAVTLRSCPLSLPRLIPTLNPRRLSAANLFGREGKFSLRGKYLCSETRSTLLGLFISGAGAELGTSLAWQN